jgi:N-hydroxyarylamine O-acetyltransferase
MSVVGASIDRYHDRMSTFNLEQYFERIGLRDPARVDIPTLFAVHRSHVEAIAFENLEIQMGGVVTLDDEALQAKMVRRRRGGYCFEQNSLFALALRAIGFEVQTCEARVRQGAAGHVRPRTHMVLSVSCGGREWLADVGFGGDGLVEPIERTDGTSEQAGVLYRTVREGSLSVLQRRVTAGWEDLSAVLPDPAHPIDFQVGNWFTSTYPGSPFVLNLTAQRMVGGMRHILRNLTYSVSRGLDVQTREITRAELVPLLRDTFGLDVPLDATFRALDAGTPVSAAAAGVPSAQAATIGAAT